MERRPQAGEQQQHARCAPQHGEWQAAEVSIEQQGQGACRHHACQPAQRRQHRRIAPRCKGKDDELAIVPQLRREITPERRALGRCAHRGGLGTDKEGAAGQDEGKAEKERPRLIGDEAGHPGATGRPYGKADRCGKEKGSAQAPCWAGGGIAFCGELNPPRHFGKQAGDERRKKRLHPTLAVKALAQSRKVEAGHVFACGVDVDSITHRLKEGERGDSAARFAQPVFQHMGQPRDGGEAMFGRGTADIVNFTRDSVRRPAGQAACHALNPVGKLRPERAGSIEPRCLWCRSHGQSPVRA